MAAAASTSMAATAVLMHRLPAAKNAVVFSPLSNPKPISSTPFKPLKGHTRPSQLVVKASSSDETPLDANELFTDLKEKWDAVENKQTVILYGGGAIVAVWLASIVVGAINSIPLVPKIMELVGLGYTGWFVYRYLLFKSSREELATDIEEIKKKIAGTIE
ncbi:protein curvature thylakoid 1a chloroplastic [Phtheirospermum japonicum]|uniref:Protein curvature thylakoid 1a chloroplastic n=1 Tax=Phtheirospermum japonicum TaxID=374723 RepID=A0A830CDM6_9LAMI|nr:protein curvature thylakoid 1a chloroplastic [Phtheirospermum japonicum]